MSKKDHITRQRIIRAARIRFMRDGYKSTSTRKIAQDTKITQPNLYHHFKNKEALYIAVMKSVGEDVKKELNHIKDKHSKKLKQALVKMTLYLQKEHPFNFYMMMNDLKEELSEESSYKLYQIFRDAYQKPFIQLFEQHSDQLRSDKETSIIASHYFLVIAPYINPDILPYGNLTIEQIIDMFLGGVINGNTNQ